MVKGHSLFLAEATSTDKHTHVGMCLHSQKNTCKRVTIRIRVTRNVFFLPKGYNTGVARHPFCGTADVVFASALEMGRVSHHPNSATSNGVTDLTKFPAF